jgi:hypothetical protein
MDEDPDGQWKSLEVRCRVALDLFQRIPTTKKGGGKGKELQNVVYVVVLNNETVYQLQWV